MKKLNLKKETVEQLDRVLMGQAYGGFQTDELCEGDTNYSKGPECESDGGAGSCGEHSCDNCWSEDCFSDTCHVYSENHPCYTDEYEGC